MPFEGQTGSEEIPIPQEVSMSPNGGGSGESSAEIIRELPPPLSLAEELGVVPFASESEYSEVECLCSEIFTWEVFEIFLTLQTKEIPTFLAEHTAEILDFFNSRSKNSYRLLFFLREESCARLLGIFSFQKDLEDEKISHTYRYFLIFITFFLVSNVVAEQAKLHIDITLRSDSLPSDFLFQSVAREQLDCDLRITCSDKMIGFLRAVLGPEFEAIFHEFARLPQFKTTPIEGDHSGIQMAHLTVLSYLRGDAVKSKAPERIFIDWKEVHRKVVPSAEGPKIFATSGLQLGADDMSMSFDIDSQVLDIILCQFELAFYPVFLRAFSDKTYLPVWEAWIARHITGLANRNTRTHEIFCRVFSPNTPITTLLVYKKNQWAVSSAARKNIPQVLTRALEQSANACPDLIPPKSHPVCAIPLNVANRTVSILDRGKPAPEEFEHRIPPITIEKPQIAVPIPTASQIFPGYQENSPKGLHKGELLEIDLRGLEQNLPTGTRVSFKRGHASKPKSIESLDCELGAITKIPPYSGSKDGKLVYAVDFALPEGYAPIGLCLVTASVYYTCPKQLGAQTVEVESEEKAKENNPVSESMTALELLLGDLIETGKSKRVVCVPEEQGNRFRIAVRGNHWEGGPYDDFGKYPLEEHSSWLIVLGDEGEVIIEPKKHAGEIPGNSKIIEYLTMIATNERKKYHARISAEKEKAELRPFREHYAPLLGFLGDLPFNKSKNEDKDLGEVQNQILTILPTILLSGQWKMPYTGNTGDSQITWLFEGNALHPPLRIIYTDRSGESFRVEPNPGTILTSAQVSFFLELADLFSPIVAFLYPTGTTSGVGFRPASGTSPSKSIGKRNIAALKARRQHLGYIQEFQERLQTGNAAMMILGEKDLRKESTELFPGGDTPSEVPFKVGIRSGPNNITINEALIEYPNAFCVYRRPSVCFNGHVLNEKAKYHGLGMYASLLKSAHALEILRERILISLNLVDIRKNPDLVDREKIEGNKAGRILSQLAQEHGITLGNFAHASRVTDDFLRLFIQRLEMEKIGIHYTRGVYEKPERHIHAVERADERRREREEKLTADGSHQIVA